ncbi:hypothetical protein NVP1016O_16 [Vibrio phage 1.016.O._10N.286.46.A11]|nr:hypothetical protein NVP1016O_16 [Vibrio phage 1.016.O._10N.286.46.A11]AUR85245.1 hypothetical protein NVP1071A_15 [Vibrio phage 1.071.A._10N.286.46.A12]
MSKQFGLDGVSDHVEFGKDGNKLDMTNGHALVTDHAGDAIEVRGKDATHSSSFATKGQLDAATGADGGTVWIEYTTEPEITSLSANTYVEFDLTTGAADLMADHSTIPSGITWNGSDARTYAIDITNGLIKPNDLNKQPHLISVEIAYANVGGSTDNDTEMKVKLVEYDGTNEKNNPTIIKTFRKAYNDGGSGTTTIDFNTNASSHTNGTGKGWRLYFASNEGDGSVSIKIKSIRMKCG